MPPEYLQQLIAGRAEQQRRDTQILVKTFEHVSDLLYRANISHDRNDLLINFYQAYGAVLLSIELLEDRAMLRSNPSASGADERTTPTPGTPGGSGEPSTPTPQRSEAESDKTASREARPLDGLEMGEQYSVLSEKIWTSIHDAMPVSGKIVAVCYTDISLVVDPQREVEGTITYMIPNKTWIIDHIEGNKTNRTTVPVSLVTGWRYLEQKGGQDA